MKELEYPFDPLLILKNRKKLKKELLNQKNLIEKRIAILSGSTIGEIKSILELFLLNNQIKPIFWEGNYNRFYEDVVFENKELSDFKPDIIYIHTTSRNINILDNCNYIEQIEDIYNKFEDIWLKIEKTYNCVIIQNNFEMLPYRIMGNSSVYKEEGNLNFIRLLNEKFYSYANTNKNFLIQDINYLSAWVGLEKWFDSKNWYAYKYAMSFEALPLLCHNLGIIIKSIYGKNKKALILDLDNTLWGGVIGDDGIDNIQIGQESPLGLLYMDFQNYLKQVSKFGILLNICSKNEENVAREGFTHPASILKEEDFIVFKANWLHKYENIRTIVNQLNILANSAVFIDDNPVEREEIRKFIPEIQVLDVTSPEKFITILDHSGFFEVTTESRDDKNRNEYYKNELKRQESKNLFDKYDDYLKSLEMICYVSSINKKNYERVTQLINKTNQFNFTSLRYTEKEVEALISKRNYITITLHLKDKYGDNGLVSVLIASIKDDSANIELWVMSCRVFKRDLEVTMFDELILECKKRNINSLIGYYKSTNKNNLIKDFYKNMDFVLLSSSEDEDIWKYDISNQYINKNRVMEVIRDE
jgi:FkbH-like protein